MQKGLQKQIEEQRTNSANNDLKCMDTFNSLNITDEQFSLNCQLKVNSWKRWLKIIFEIAKSARFTAEIATSNQSTVQIAS